MASSESKESKDSKVQVPCGICSREFTVRMLGQHGNGSHLGTECYYPGSNFVQETENDEAMSDELVRVNQKRCEDAGDGADKNYCRWPGCPIDKHNNGYHYYKKKKDLKYHLQCQQRKEFTQKSPATCGQWNRKDPGFDEHQVESAKERVVAIIETLTKAQNSFRNNAFQDAWISQDEAVKQLENLRMELANGMNRDTTGAPQASAPAQAAMPSPAQLLGNPPASAFNNAYPAVSPPIDPDLGNMYGLYMPQEGTNLPDVDLTSALMALTQDEQQEDTYAGHE
ncbi:hypothetical protein F5Y15DRAFT_422995 [Xylariaceae sp. FL0016]|nr:hypothetical protein F5Y15DRAFT_422995 [Xylariaceae sp. FL0016]